ncbi:extracellular solute-binding protein [Nocardioides convexus]|uniref:extracellular solute-binding protein n=1 Tax=Nocardioides convexus TaxID=2712224 RepID=UPI00241814AC|nr:extracellular solute-binding protein [Nocardioides convexus]
MTGALALTACASADGGSDSKDKTINIVGFAVPEAGNKAAAVEFNKTDAGKDVKFSGAYGPSGDQSRKVADTKGKDTDYVVFSLEPDMTRLVDAGLVDEKLEPGPQQGHRLQARSPSSPPRRATRSASRTGATSRAPTSRSSPPTRPGSGSAKWNVLALYTYAKSTGATEEQANAFLVKVFKNVKTWAASGREATEAFKKGVGNVLLTYENEAILAKQNGEDLDYVVPDHTFKIENPGAVLKDSVPVAKDWLDFILSDKGQAGLRVQGLPPGDRRRHQRRQGRGCQRPEQPLPAGQGPEHRRRPRRLERHQQGVVRQGRRQTPLRQSCTPKPRSSDRHARVIPRAGSDQEPALGPCQGRQARAASRSPSPLASASA